MLLLARFFCALSTGLWAILVSSGVQGYFQDVAPWVSTGQKNRIWLVVPGRDIKQKGTSVHILALAFPGCVTWDKSLYSLNLSFLNCELGQMSIIKRDDSHWPFGTWHEPSKLPLSHPSLLNRQQTSGVSGSLSHVNKLFKANYLIPKQTQVMLLTVLSQCLRLKV